MVSDLESTTVNRGLLLAVFVANWLTIGLVDEEEED
jgi:hypothetical protein